MQATRSNYTDPGPQDPPPPVQFLQDFGRLPKQFADTHLFTWAERGTVKVYGLAQEHNTMTPASFRAQSRSIQSPDF